MCRILVGKWVEGVHCVLSSIFDYSTKKKREVKLQIGEKTVRQVSAKVDQQRIEKVPCLGQFNMHRGIYDLSLSGFHFIMCHRITSKIRKTGATSKEKAVTVDKAGFDFQEQRWLQYFTGVFLSGIKKTKDKRYNI